MPCLQIAVYISEFSTIVTSLCLHWNRHFLQVNYANVDLYSSTFLPSSRPACRILSSFKKWYWKRQHFIPSKENVCFIPLRLIHTWKQKQFFDSELIPLFKFYGNFNNATKTKAHELCCSNSTGVHAPIQLSFTSLPLMEKLPHIYHEVKGGM